jgi:hypothetical protein
VARLQLIVNVKLLRLLGPEVDVGAKALNCENVEKTLGLPHSAILAVCSQASSAGQQRRGELQIAKENATCVRRSTSD